MKKMKIIKYGKKPEELEYVKKCPNCKTVFVYQDNESTYELDVSGSIDHFVKCPFCEYNIPVGLFRKVYIPEKHGIALEIKKEENKEVEDNKIDIGFRKENVKDDRTDK